MKKIPALIVSLMAMPALADDAKKILESRQQEISYSFGAVLGKRMRNDIPELDIPAFMQGLAATYEGNTPLLTDQRMLEIISSFQREMQQKQVGRIGQVAAENLKSEAEFLAANQQKEGVVTLPSGLQYRVLVEGKGPQASLSDVVKLHYTGTLRNGKVFDSSKSGAPVSVPVDDAIAGWAEALQLMPQGSTWQLFIPSKLAYGQNGNRQIGPNEVLLYEIEVVEVKPR